MLVVLVRGGRTCRGLRVNARAALAPAALGVLVGLALGCERQAERSCYADDLFTGYDDFGRTLVCGLDYGGELANIRDDDGLWGHLVRVCTEAPTRCEATCDVDSMAASMETRLLERRPDCDGSIDRVEPLCGPTPDAEECCHYALVWAACSAEIDPVMP